jgi:glycerol kinase
LVAPFHKGDDVGSSSVKAAAYSEDGVLLAEASHPLTPIYPAPGQWETDPNDIWQAWALAAHEAVQRDPPKAVAVSASGRENFPRRQRR